MTTPPPPPLPSNIHRRNAVSLKLLFIAALVLIMLIPLHLVNALRQERSENRRRGLDLPVATAGAGASERQRVAAEVARAEQAAAAAGVTAFEGYRMVERAVKHGALVLALVFAAFFLFEVLAGLRLHAVHYGLVGAALCLFYLALLALGEVLAPGWAYGGAAGASSLLITLYSAAILRAWGRAALIAALLAAVYGILYVVLRMEDFALLAGTGALFVALAAIMYCTRRIDWQAHDASAPVGAEAAR
jgi:inner membrane protein involved in colicin E2 resistance